MRRWWVTPTTVVYLETEMATDYFAHYAYGVLLENDDAEKVLSTILKSTDEFDAELDEINNGSNLLRDLQKKYQAPENSVLMHTGYDDDRPGRCQTDAEEFILGFGVYDFPDIEIQMSDHYRSQAEWHSWVS